MFTDGLHTLGYILLQIHFVEILTTVLRPNSSGT